MRHCHVVGHVGRFRWEIPALQRAAERALRVDDDDLPDVNDDAFERDLERGP